ncbi:sugar ABC transporter permease [Pseudoponticoccus marisrubri]|uniref:Transport permease protein n=2 Tax=Pseudoponticoccus marisrubri TaxID=1685382 RepID=A0A0W7WEC2_9RHOB|nr:sugar ABC transporter permease [Pseudoponticoccus marisrubri]
MRAIPRRSFASLRTITALILREMSTRYGRSPGGYVWAVIEPLGAIILLSYGFSLLVRTPSLGNNFFLFYASGYLTFNMYQQISVLVARSISYSRPLLQYPAVTWADAMLARLILNSLTGVMVSFIILLLTFTFAETRAPIEIMPILRSFLLAILLGFGIGSLNCALSGLYPTWDLIWSIATRPLFLASGIFYIYEDMPQTVQSVLWFNPLIHMSGMMRSGIYPTYVPEYVSVPFVLTVSLVTGALGMVLLGRYHRDILQNA